MLATLNSKQIVDEIVKDTMRDNDPHDAVQISPDVVLASRAGRDAPTLAPEITPRTEPKISAAAEAPAAAPSVDTAIRAAASDMPGRDKRSGLRKWLNGALVTMLLAGASTAATIAWEQNGDMARQMIVAWVPALSSTLAPAAPEATPATTEQAASSPPQTAANPPADQPAAPATVQDGVGAPVTATDAASSLQSMTRDLAAMAQQVEQLKASVADLKAGQEQMAREMAKAQAPKPVAEAKPVETHARVSALPPRPPVAPVRKPRPVATQTFAPAPLAPPPPPSQAAAVPPPPAVAAPSVADDDGPIVRPPMPLH
jgi:hypothetical protein